MSGLSTNRPRPEGGYENEIVRILSARTAASTWILRFRVTRDTPPTFLPQAEDESHEHNVINVLAFYIVPKKAGVPAAMSPVRARRPRFRIVEDEISDW